MNNFKDYYAILKIEYPSTIEEIRKAYKTASKQWHPDMNIGQDTTLQMQNINEAYYILGDIRKKTLYDAEYICYLKTKSNYNIKNEDLKTDIKEAQTTAKKYTTEFYQSLHKDSKDAIYGAWEGMKGYIIGGIIAFIIFICIQQCS